MTAALYHAKLEKTLERMGGLYTLEDILERIADGRMQSFTEGNSWMITQIGVYPRRRVLELFATTGDLKDRAVYDKVLAFAKEMGIDLLVGVGRRGWLPEAEKHGFKVKTVSYLYYREL